MSASPFIILMAGKSGIDGFRPRVWALFVLLTAVGLVQAADTTGPKVIGQIPLQVASNSGPLNQVTVSFDEAMDPASFTAEDVVLVDPMGTAIPVTISLLTGSTNQTFNLSFADQTVRGTYRLAVGPNVTDVAGNPMNQDGDISNGEAADAYNAAITFESTTPTLGSGPVLFSEGFESWPPAPGYWSFVTAGTGAVSVVTTDSPKSGSQHLELLASSYLQSQSAILKLNLGAYAGATDLYLDFWAKLLDNASWGTMYVEVSGDGVTWRQLLVTDPPGTYQNYAIDLDAELVAGSIALNGDVFIRFRNRQSWAYGYQYRILLEDVRITRGVDLVGPRVTNLSPTLVAANVGSLNSIRLTFDEVIDPASFTPEDVTLYDPMGTVVPVTVSVLAGSTNQAFDLAFADQAVRGTYRLTVGPNVTDVAGNPMNQDVDLSSGETNGDDTYTSTIILQTQSYSGSLPFNETFEVGSLGALPSYWEFKASYGGFVTLVGTNSPLSGDWHLMLGSTNYSPSSSEEAVLHLDLSGKSGVTLDFGFKGPRSGGGSLWVRPNSTSSWVSLFYLWDYPASTYEKRTIDLDTVVAQQGWSYSTDFQIKWEHSYHPVANSWFIDDVRIQENADVTGPKVANISPVVVASDGGPLNWVTVTFDESMDPPSFTAEDVVLMSPMGTVIPVTTVSVVAGSTNQTFDLGIADQTVRGTYRLTVGPNVTDAAGNPMNQDGDISNGENTDAYNGTTTFESTVPALGSGPVLFNEGFESWPPVPGYWSFVPAGTFTAVNSLGPQGGLQHLRLEATNYNVSQWATLRLDLSAYAGSTDLFLDFWAKLSANASGQFYVEVSGDGQTWRQTLSTDPSSAYQNYVIDLDAELAAGSIALDSDVYIRFRDIQTTSSSIGWYYRVFLDDVRITHGPPALLLSAAPGSFPENAGNAASFATLKRINTTDFTSDLTATLSGPSNVVVLPESVLIPSTATETNFYIGAVDDGVAAGDREVTVTASAAGFADGTATMTLLEATPAQIGLIILGTAVSEAAGANVLTGMVTRDRGLDTNLIVTLTSSDTTAITTPLTVTIPAGETAVVFSLSPINDGEIDGTQTALITASAPDFADQAVSIDVLDDDTEATRTVGGSLSGTLADWTYLVAQPLIIPQGATLTILPGASLEFPGNSYLSVQGTLFAQGQPGSEIHFSSASSNPALGDWQGIKFDSTSSLTSILDHVEISFANIGVEVRDDASKLLLQHSSITSNSTSGVKVDLSSGEYTSDGQIQIVECQLNHNQYGVYLGAYASGCDGSGNYTRIRQNTILNNSSAGIRLYASASGFSGCTFAKTGYISSQIEANVIAGNAKGIWASGYDGYHAYGSVSPTIINNLICSNTAQGILLESEFYGSLRNNTIVNNGQEGVRHFLSNGRAPTAYNNLIVSNGSGFVGVSAVTNLAATVWANDVFANTNGNWSNYPVEFGDLSTTNRNGVVADIYQNISADPLFESATSFRLTRPSPAINAGTSTNAPTADIEGNTRDVMKDMGAYEYPLIAPQVTQQPADTTVFAGQSATFTVGVAGDPLPSVQWQSSIDGGTNWVNLSDGGGISGSATTTLSISSVTMDMDGESFRAVVTNQIGTATSASATLNVLSSGLTGATSTSGVITVNTDTPGTQYLPRVGMDAQGRFGIEFVTLAPGIPVNLRGRTFDSTGVALSSEFNANTLISNGSDGRHDLFPSLGMADNGNFVTAWQSFGAQDTGLGNLGIYFRRFDINGNALSGDIQVNQSGVGKEPGLDNENNPYDGYQSWPSVAVWPEGQFVVAWARYIDSTSKWDIYARRFDASGNPMGNEFQVNSTTVGEQRNASVAVAPDGRFVIAWQSEGQDGDDFGIVAQRFDASGSPQGGEILVNGVTAGMQERPQVVVDDSANFLVQWRGYGDNSAPGAFARLFLADGTPRGPQFAAAFGDSLSPSLDARVAMKGDGVFASIWTLGGEAWAQVFFPDGSRAGESFLATATGEGAWPDVALRDDGSMVVAWGSPDASGTGIYARLWKLSYGGVPQITSQPGDQAVIAGDTATFSVTAQSNTPLSYQWLKSVVSGEWSVISGATNAQLAILNVQPADSGSQYSVVVTNDSGSVTSTVATLTVSTINPGGVVWTFTNTDTITGHPCVDSAGKVYFTAANGDLVAVTIETGQLAWRTPGLGAATPVMASDQRIIVAGAGTVYCVRASDGVQLWTHQRTGVSWTPAAGVSTEQVVMAASDGLVEALSLDAGATLWSVDLGGGISAQPAVAPSGLVFVGVNGRGLFLLDGATGTTLASSVGHWTPQKANFSFSGLAIANDGTVYAGVNYPDYFGASIPGGFLACFAPGVPLASWEKLINYSITAPVVGSDGTIFVGSGGTASKFLFAVGPDGNTRWSTGLNDSNWFGSAGSALLGAQGILYVIGPEFADLGNGGHSMVSRRVLYTLDAVTGNILWASTASSSYGTPSMSSGGVLLVADGSSFKAIETPSSGLAADAPWPKVYANTANSGQGGNAAFTPVMISQPQNKSAGEAASAQFTGAAAGAPTPTLVWQRSIDGGSTWEDLSDGLVFTGVNTDTLLIGSVTVEMNGHEFRLLASNSAGVIASQAATLTVNPPPPVITSAETATGTVGQTFNYQIAADNNPTGFDATGLPAGLGVNTGTGLISGTPTTAGNSTVTLSASNTGGTGTKTLTLTINPPAPVITSVETATGTVGQTFNYQIVASNNPTGFDATGLPAGLGVNTGTGLISGTPTAVGTSTVTLSASNAGGTGTKTLTLMVNAAGEFVLRQLPAGYAPGIKLTVTLVASPAAGTQVYAVEDSPSLNWTVSNISAGGTFDGANGKVKFGPFFDATARTLTYDVTPPVDEAGTKQFTGTGSVDGVDSLVGGQSSLNLAPYHPADNNPADYRMVIGEVTAYGAAWKTGQTWPSDPNPIPIGYVTRAGALWKGGEAYTFDPATNAPLWWVNASGSTGAFRVANKDRLAVRSAVQTGISTGTRAVLSRCVTNVPFTVTVLVTSASGVSAWAVEDKPPVGWQVSSITEGGTFDSVNQKVKWGPFFDNAERSLSYDLAPAGIPGDTAVFTGTCSFDGADKVLAGSEQVSLIETQLASIVQPPLMLQKGEAVVGFLTTPGKTYVLEASTDLIVWSTIYTNTAANGSLFFRDSGATNYPGRFYRVQEQ